MSRHGSEQATAVQARADPSLRTCAECGIRWPSAWGAGIAYGAKTLTASSQTLRIARSSGDSARVRTGRASVPDRQMQGHDAAGISTRLSRW
jgi:hypothetical protein